MKGEHESVSNHILETLHRVINEIWSQGYLPRTLFVQACNCVCENKNRYFPSYLEFLVWISVFDHVKIGLPPVGRTHLHVDQAFSTTSNRLRYHDALTLSDLQNEVRQCYNHQICKAHLDLVGSWSGLFMNTKCCNEVDQMT